MQLDGNEIVFRTNLLATLARREVGPVFETTRTDDRATAEAIKAKRENELLERSVFGSGATVSFLEAAPRT